MGESVAEGLGGAKFDDVNVRLFSARDEQIERIVEMVDHMPFRGDVDALIAPMRLRLASLRKRRPLSFARLLFTPLDPLIVPGETWRRDRLGLPRSGLLPLARQCRALLGVAAEPAEHLIAGRRTDDVEAMRQAGAILWPLAAACLADAPPNADWASVTGLTTGDHANAVRLTVAVLRESVPIELMVARIAEGRQPDMAVVRPMVVRAARTGDARGLGALVAVLLARLPAPGQVLGAVGEIAQNGPDTAIRATADRAIELMLDTANPADIAAMDIGRATDELRRVAALLDGVERPGPGNRNATRGRGAAIRAAMRVVCQARFTADLTASVLAPFTSGAAARDDAAQAAIEAAARGLRGLEDASRILVGDGNDAALQHAAETLRAGSGPLIDRIRVAEILLGAERAGAMLADLP